MKNADDIQHMQVRHVVIVSDFADINGGQAKVAIDSARLLADAGIKVTFFAATGPVHPLLNATGIETVCLDQHTLLDNPSRVNAMLTGLWNASAARALADTLGACDPAHTVIHCHGWAKALSPSIGRVLGASPIPTLYTMHEYFLACPNGGFFDFRKQEICHRSPLSAACLSTNCDARHPAHKAWRSLRTLIANTLGRMPGKLEHIAYISETQRAAMAPYLPASTRLHALPNPVATGGEKVDASRNSEYVFIGRLAPEKGCTLFAKAARKANIPAIFVGDGPEADNIRAVNPDAVITGWVSPEQVQHHISTARAVVFPSLWYEGQPLVPIEALLRGVPVICGSWCAASESVSHGTNGVIFDAPTVDALTQALLDVTRIPPFETPELAELVSPRNHVARLLEIYREMLAPTPG
ncbi:glycosyltransferase family 4 protein [Pelagimonas sp. KU-00592-HH]|uniref:glycosyltransferase family 4 protein n=1 Tax=Pelagimonas sp. KU-00592-HH TaxID=3127651 RepID=UPI0031033F20